MKKLVKIIVIGLMLTGACSQAEAVEKENPQNYPNTNIVIINEDKQVDLLSAANIAIDKNAKIVPIKNDINDTMRLAGMNPKKIYIIGGEDSISKDIEYAVNYAHL